jgi:hypothetical protein
LKLPFFVNGLKISRFDPLIGDFSLIFMDCWDYSF